MSQAAKKATVSRPASPDLELYLLRDELAETHQPQNVQERQLVAAIAENWIRFQEARKLEQQFLRDNDMREVLRDRLDAFKAVTRYAADCERAWRHCVTRLEIMKRRRPKSLASPEARRSWNRLEGKLPPDKPLKPVYTSVMKATRKQVESIRKHQKRRE
ncbi:MAG: hypothetical protein JSU00_31145 [Acidobacteria bacterium]|nr:hypothetical protein [Acidobacteriota bacterium]